MIATRGARCALVILVPTKVNVSMNPYEASKTEQPQADPGDPVVATEVPTPRWLRVLLIGAPFLAGTTFMLAIQDAFNRRFGWMAFFLAATLLLMFRAGRWTR